MEKVKRAMGVEWHKTVAAYSPSHNGLIEKFAGTFGNAIRKLAEKDHTKWFEWIPFIKLAYNTRIHTTTKKTPYELTFGMKCNTFEDWSEYEGEDLTKALENRAVQNRNLIQERERVVETIKDAQEKQKDKQNKRTKRLIRTHLEKGTIVYRRNDGIINKLEPRWIGPYKIFDHDERGNYSLIDSLGIGLSRKYPLEKLKIVDKSQYNDNLSEVKRILNDRTRNNTIEYLVEWKDKSEKEWVNENEFQTIEIINDYWKSKAGEPVKRGRGRPPKKLHMILSILLILIMSAQTLATNMFCTGAERSPIIDIDEICQWKQIPQRNFTEFAQEYGTKRLLILSKNKHEVTGTGFKCKSIKVKSINCSKSFFGVETCSRSEWKPIKLTSEDCWNMQNTKHCTIEEANYNRKMNCNDNGCYLEDIPNDKFNWLETNYLHGYKCSIFNTGIIADTPESEIYYEKRCKVNEFSCNTNNAILVWNKSVIHNCPYEEIKIPGSFTWSEDRILINTDSNVVLEPIEKFKTCEVTMFKTSEGLYVVQGHERRKLLNLTYNESHQVTDKLIFANIDFNQATEAIWIKFVDTQVCTTFYTILQLFSKTENEYIKVTNKKGEKVILYTKYGKIYAPECTQVKEIEPIMKQTKCFREIPIKFKFKSNDTIYGYINSEGVITMRAKEIDCKEPSNKIEIKMNSETMIYQRIDSEIVTERKRDYKILDFKIINEEIGKLNLHHPEPIMIGYDELKELFNLTVHKDEEISILIDATKDDIAKGIFGNIVNQVKTFFITPLTKIFNYADIIIACIFAIVIILIIIYVIVKTKPWRICSKIRKHKQKKQQKLKQRKAEKMK
jgi:hypothetical protein